MAVVEKNAPKCPGGNSNSLWWEQRLEGEGGEKESMHSQTFEFE